VTIGLSIGCRKNAVDKGAYKSAINNYFSTRPDCLWTAPIKLPAQADTSNDEQTKGFDALTDAGLLVRKSAEKKRFLIGSKQVNDYDLSDKGRTTWTAEQTQPGYGNFCYGHPEVTSIDSYSPPDNPDATQFSVSYHYAVTLSEWANSTEIKTAFPRVAADSAGQTGTASLSKSNDGWVVVNTQPVSNAPPTQ
jgi:hypothetical protein